MARKKTSWELSTWPLPPPPSPWLRKSLAAPLEKFRCVSHNECHCNPVLSIGGSFQAENWLITNSKNLTVKETVVLVQECKIILHINFGCTRLECSEKLICLWSRLTLDPPWTLKPRLSMWDSTSATEVASQPVRNRF